MLNDPAVKDPDAGEEQLSGVKAALDCIEDFVDNMDMVSFNILPQILRGSGFWAL